ncbi:MAG: hypothetical protein H7A35_01210 [Planctomycetales bacterium]|nr:hypothetical protein [bacterium]UNM08678.1 MAG: hypothetical protein H7A35_01210 [Planctomycetales bacterium]
MTLPNADLLCFIAAGTCVLLGLFCLMMLALKRIRSEFTSTMRAIAGFNFLVAVGMLLLGMRVEASAAGFSQLRIEEAQHSASTPRQADYGHDILGNLRDSTAETP